MYYRVNIVQKSKCNLTSPKRSPGWHSNVLFVHLHESTSVSIDTRFERDGIPPYTGWLNWLDHNKTDSQVWTFIAFIFHLSCITRTKEYYENIGEMTHYRRLKRFSLKVTFLLRANEEYTKYKWSETTKFC